MLRLQIDTRAIVYGTGGFSCSLFFSSFHSPRPAFETALAEYEQQKLQLHQLQHELEIQKTEKEKIDFEAAECGLFLKRIAALRKSMGGESAEWFCCGKALAEYCNSESLDLDIAVVVGCVCYLCGCGHGDERRTLLDLWLAKAAELEIEPTGTCFQEYVVEVFSVCCVL